jgi:hypothetical protein
LRFQECDLTFLGQVIRIETTVPVALRDLPGCLLDEKREPIRLVYLTH